MNKNTKQVFVVSAPSGGGKTTLNRLLVSRHPNIEISVSLTTRPMRIGEVPGVDYYFVSTKEFQEKVQHQDMIEWATVHDNMYGTSRQYIEDIQNRGRIPLLEIDVQGWESIHAQFTNAKAVFILPPDIKTLWQRLAHRGTDSEAVRWRRMQSARNEILKSSSYHYFLINDDRNSALDELESVLVLGKKPQLSHNEGVVFCQKLLDEFNKADWLIELGAKHGKL